MHDRRLLISGENISRCQSGFTSGFLHIDREQNADKIQSFMNQSMITEALETIVD